MRALLERLGRLVARHPRPILLMWLVAALGAAWCARGLDQVLGHGVGPVGGSDSASVELALAKDFDHPFFPAGFVTVREEAAQAGAAAPAHGSSASSAVGSSAATATRSPGAVAPGSPGVRTLPSSAMRAVLADLERELAGQSLIEAVRTPLTAPEIPVVTGKSGTTTFALVGLTASSVSEAGRAVPAVRALVEPVRKRHPAFELAYVSEAAINHDVERRTLSDAAKAERLALPLALAVLVLAFRTPVAAGLPLAVGFAAVLPALATLHAIALVAPPSAFALSIAVMLGLGLGIDYALFMLMRFREERAAGRPVEAAVGVAVARAGSAVVASGLTVCIGLAALLASGLRDPASVGLGGLVVAAFAVLAALTLLPALLALLGDRLERFPLFVRLASRPRIPWERLAGRVADRPLLAILAALAILGPLMLPAFGGRNGYPPSRFFPPELEASVGSSRLEEVGQNGGLAPVYVLVQAPAGTRPTDGSFVIGLFELSRAIAADPDVQRISSLVDLDPALPLASYQSLFFYPDLAFSSRPEARRMFLSRDRRSTVLQVQPRSDLDFDGRMDLVRRVRAQVARLPGGLGGSRVAVGGPAAAGVDVMDRLADRFPLIVAGVVAATYAVLMLAFNSWLLPLMAIALNALTVLGGYGALVLVFQEGHLASWLGLPGAVGSVPVLVPLIVFCLVFGLSMDYQVFILSRIAECREARGDTRQATVQGVAGTARVVTSAALIMLVVFGAFAFAGSLAVKMVGVGLLVAVLLDATLVRLLLLPALVGLLGERCWIGPFTVQEAAAAVAGERATS